MLIICRLILYLVAIDTAGCIDLIDRNLSTIDDRLTIDSCTTSQRSLGTDLPCKI